MSFSYCQAYAWEYRTVEDGTVGSSEVGYSLAISSVLEHPVRHVLLAQTAVGEQGAHLSTGGKQSNRIELMPSPDFPTIDPAPSSLPQSIPELRTALLNTKSPLFERYRAMFALRDFGAASKEAVLALAEGFGDASALFRYVCYPSLLLLLLFSLQIGHTHKNFFHFTASPLHMGNTIALAT